MQITEVIHKINSVPRKKEHNPLDASLQSWILNVQL